MGAGPIAEAGRTRRAAWLALGFAAALAAAGCNGPNMDAAFPVGTCAVLIGPTDGGYGVNAADCSKAHTHIVIARVGPGQTCPPGTDVVFEMSGGTRCFRADASPRATP
jgi:hypothetical protein